MHIVRKRAAVGGRDGGRLWRSVRAAMVAVVAMAFAVAFAGSAAAQCAPPFTPGCPSPDPVSSSSGNSHVSGQAALVDLGGSFLQRLSAVTSFRSGASPANNPQGGGADAPSQRYRTWFEVYGLASRTDAQNAFTGDHRRTYGGVAGFGVTVAPGVTVGMSIDQSRTKVDVTAAAQSATIDLTQIAAIAAFEQGPWNLGTTVVYGFGNVDSSRFDAVGQSAASYDARLWAGLAELSYYWSLPDNTRIVPKLSFDVTQSRTDAFVETGGATPVAGSAVTATRVRMMAGAEWGHSWLYQRTIMDFAVYARLVDNLIQNLGTIQISDPTGAFQPTSVSGVRESQQGADAGATLSAKLSETLRLYAVYDGRFRSNFTSHGATVGAEFRF